MYERKRKDMKKRVLIILLCMAMVLCLLPSAALAAAPTEVYVGIEDVTTGYETAKALPTASGMSGTVTYASGVLTLNNVTVPSTEFHNYAAIHANGDLTIKLIGNNDVTGPNNAEWSNGIYVYGSLTIQNADNNNPGALTATGSTASVYDSYGICANNGNLTITGGTVTGAGSAGKYSNGIYAHNSISVSGAATVVTGTGNNATNDNSNGICANNGDLTVTGGTVIGTAGNAARFSNGIFVKNNISVSGAADITGTGEESTNSNSYGICADTGSLTVSDNTASVKGEGGTASSGVSIGIIANTGGSITGGKVIAKGNTAAMGGTQLPSFGTIAWYKWRKTDSGAYTRSSGTALTLRTTDPLDTYVELTTDDVYIKTQPQNQTVYLGSISGTLITEAKGSPAGTPSYEWFKCDDATKENSVTAGTGASYTIPTDLALGTYHYYCQATLNAVTADSNVVTVTVINQPVSSGNVDIPFAIPAQLRSGDFGINIWLTSNDVYANDLLLVDALTSGSDYNAILQYAGGKAVFGVYNLRLQGGVQNPDAMYLHFNVGAKYAGESFTLVHKKANGTYESFTGAVNSNGELVFGPLYELSPFMLVGSMASGVSIPDSTIETVPETGDNAMPGAWLGILLMTGTALAAGGLFFRGRPKEQG